MALESAISIGRPASLRGRSLTQRAAEYFGMSGPAEFVAAVSLFTLMIVIRLVNMMQSRFDTDESQHMHVIWAWARRSEEHTSELQSRFDLVCRLLLEKK